MVERKRLGEMLIDAGLINSAELEDTLLNAKKAGLKLGQFLIKKGIVTENLIVDTVSQQTHIKKFDPTEYSISEDIAKLMDVDSVNKFQAIPVVREDMVLTVAMVDPLDILAIDYIEILTEMEVLPVICTEHNFNYLLSSIFGAYTGKDGVMQQVQEIQKMDVDKEEDSYQSET